MPEMVSISVNGESRVPPGFRFHPTEEELLQYYLRKKLAFEKIDLDVIVEVDLNKLEPWDIQERCKIGSTPQNDWYFFSHKDKKYPTGTRTNRATIAGFWKATGRDKIIYGNGVRIGMRKTLVFYTGRAPHGMKSDWIMHEYRLDENGSSNSTTNLPNIMEMGKEEGWVVCRIFKKKHFQKSRGDESNNSISDLTESPSEGTLEQIFQNIGGNTSEDKSMYSMNNVIFNNSNNNNQTAYQCGKNMMKLPSLKSPTTTSRICEVNYNPAMNLENKSYDEQPLVGDGELSDWAVIDRLLAAHLSDQQHHTIDTNGQTLVDVSSIGGQSEDGDYQRRRLEMSIRSSSSFSSSSSSGYNHMQPNSQNYYYNGPELDLWSVVTRSSLSSSPSDNPCNAHT